MSELEQAAIDFVAASSKLSVAKKRRNSFKCTCSEPADLSVGFWGYAPCYIGSPEYLCEECAKRQKEHTNVQALQKERQAKRRMLFKIVKNWRKS